MSFPSHAVIITAAGSSSRFNADTQATIKKEFLELNGHSVLYNSTKNFLSLPNLKGVFVTYKKGLETHTLLALEEIALQEEIPVYLVEGGETRQESVFFALKDIKNKNIDVDFVSIHDGARPFVTFEQIIDTLATARIAGGSAGAIKVPDTVAKINSNGILSSYVNRENLVCIQTPQTFKFPEILEAHNQANIDKKEYSDDTQLFKMWGGQILFCKGKSTNRKITENGDLDSV